MRVQQSSRSSDSERDSGSDSDFDLSVNETDVGADAADVAFAPAATIENIVTFNEPGPLGVTFPSSAEDTASACQDWVVEDFKPNSQAAAHEAVRAGKLRVGDQLIRIGEHDLRGLSDRRVFKLFRKAGRPLSLTFTRATSIAVAAGGAASCR